MRLRKSSRLAHGHVAFTRPEDLEEERSKTNFLAVLRPEIIPWCARSRLYPLWKVLERPIRCNKLGKREVSQVAHINEQ